MSNTSFDRIIDKVFDGFKKITPALVALAIISSLILFLPNQILSKLELDKLPAYVITVISFIFLLSAALILTIIVSCLYNIIAKKLKQILVLKKLKKQYLNLSSTQKTIIKNLMKSPNKAIELNSISGDTIYLIERNFIYRPTQIVDEYNNIYTYIPQPWLLDLFEKEPQLFEK